MKRLRIYYQVFFLALFGVLMWLSAQGRLRGYPVTWFLDSSPLNALGALLASWNVAHWMWIGFVMLALTAVLGRVFCGWVCPLGTLLHGVSWLAEPRSAKERITRNRWLSAQNFKFVLTLALLTAAAFGVLQAGLCDPLALLTRSTAVVLAPMLGEAQHLITRTAPERAFQGAALIASVFCAVLALNVWRPRFWCRYVCPLGALLGAASRWVLGAITRDLQRCTNCGVCESVCPAASSPSSTIKTHECFVCWNCVARCPEAALQWRWIFNRQKMSFANDEKCRLNPPATRPDLSRRSLLGALAAGVAIVAGLRLAGTTRRRGFPLRIRPPGALPEADFLERCLKCGLCMKVCPTNVLQPALTEAGAEGFMTPVMNMTYGYCELNCTLCGQVCPTGAIQRITIAQKLGHPDGRPIKTGTAFFDRGRCLPWAMQRNCLVCQEICPVSPKAIYTVDEAVLLNDGTRAVLRRPHVDPARCIGCGLCQRECPLEDKPAIRVSAAGETRAGSSFYL